MLWSVRTDMGKGVKAVRALCGEGSQFFFDFVRKSFTDFYLLSFFSVGQNNKQTCRFDIHKMFL